jgi:hypothetical protein
LSEGSYGRRSERSERFGGQSQGLREESPRIPEALGRGSFVAVSARVGNDLSGYVCDVDVSGLLLDVRDPSGDPGGYEFLPWSSIERVRVLGKPSQASEESDVSHAEEYQGGEQDRLVDQVDGERVSPEEGQR